MSISISTSPLPWFRCCMLVSKCWRAQPSLSGLVDMYSLSIGMSLHHSSSRHSPSSLKGEFSYWKPFFTKKNIQFHPIPSHHLLYSVVPYYLSTYLFLSLSRYHRHGYGFLMLPFLVHFISPAIDVGFLCHSCHFFSFIPFFFSFCLSQKHRHLNGFLSSNFLALKFTGMVFDCRYHVLFTSPIDFIHSFSQSLSPSFFLSRESYAVSSR